MKSATTALVRRRLRSLGVIVAAVLTPAAAEVRGQGQSVFTGRVVAVLDGDSLMVLDGGREAEVGL
jgi:hypothetical protein